MLFAFLLPHSGHFAAKTHTCGQIQINCQLIAAHKQSIRHLPGLNRHGTLAAVDDQRVR